MIEYEEQGDMPEQEQCDAPEPMSMILNRAEIQIKEAIKELALDEHSAAEVTEAIEAMHMHNMECMHFNQTLMGVRLVKERKLSARNES